MKFLSRLLLVLLVITFVVSCAPYVDKEEELPQLPPPAGYNPVFINSITKFDNSKIDSPRVIISRVEPFGNEGNLTLYVHVVDSNRVFLSGATEKQFKKLWCKSFVQNKYDLKPTGLDIISVRENTPQEVKPMAIALVMDHSGSMGKDRAYAVQDAALDFINSKSDRDKLSLIKYDGVVSVQTPLTDNSSMLKNGLHRNGLEGFGGVTASSDAILAGINQVSGAGNNFQKIVIVFTDGIDNASTVLKDSVIKSAIANNVIVCGIDLGYNVNEDFMKEYAMRTQGIYHHIYLKDEFAKVFTDIKKRFEHFYVVELEQPDFGDNTVTLTLCMAKSEISGSYKFSNIPNAGDITLLKVLFDFDKSNIKKESYKEIIKVANLLKAYPEMSIEVRGHTDNLNRTGDPDYNTKLSQSRADAVRDALVKEGIAGSRIISKGFGDINPIADNSTTDGRAKNRRTEFVIVSK